MPLPRASIASSASFQISGTPYVYTTTGTSDETISFKFVTKAITVVASASGGTISFGDIANTTFPLLAGEVYRFEIKVKKVVLNAASGDISIAAEMTNVDNIQLPTHTQGDLASVS